MKYIIYTDGASSGNPGPSGAGIAIYESQGREEMRLYKEYAIPLGTMTNNQAEYSAVIFALKKLKQLIGKDKAKEADIEIRSDSELLVKQLTHKYKILDSKVKERFFDVWNLLIDFGETKFIAIPREQNTHADRLSKEGAGNQLNLLNTI